MPAKHQLAEAERRIETLEKALRDIETRCGIEPPNLATFERAIVMRFAAEIATLAHIALEEATRAS